MVATDTKTILLVEENDDSRASMTRFLLTNGYHVVEAVNGQEAVKIVRQKCPDLILMDLNMPLMDGLAATTQIRKCRDVCERVPILAITAHDTYGMREAALEAGCTDYLLKPIDFDYLERVVAGILATDGQ